MRNNKIATFSLSAFILFGCAALNRISAEEYIEINQRTIGCDFSYNDSKWVKNAIESWHYTNKEITKILEINQFDVVLFDAKCQKNSSDALSASAGITWKSKLHNNTINLPNTDSIPPAVNSFTSANSSEGEKTFFVMSLPSIWEEGGVKSNIGLEKFMVAVMLHEAMHAIQSSTYGKELERLNYKHSLPDSFNDDSVQKLFEDNSEFEKSVMSEIDLLMQAALAPTKKEAKILAKKSRDMIKVRYETWMSDDGQKYSEVDDLWLSMEGSGQWVGYSWLSNEKGGGLTKNQAIKEFGLRGKWWSQKLGFALFMAIDRLSDDWKNDAFGDGNRSVLTLLDSALEE